MSECVRCRRLPRCRSGAWIVSVLLTVSVVACKRSAPQRDGEPPRHVQLIHLDGYRADLTRALMDSGTLPNLEFLASSGKISYSAVSVDKTETMKVVQSYLTGRTETDVVGWWQFHRDDFRFRNFWMEPAEVLGYALGLEFPTQPTVLDFLAHRGENLVSGMSLARRGVPFDNYGRAYMEGLEAVSNHFYLRQADVTMERFIAIHRRIAEKGERSPAMSTLLLAAADEYSHAYGVTTSSPEDEHCVRREGESGDDAFDSTLFDLFDEDGDRTRRPFGGSLAGLEDRYFTRVEREGGRVEEVCFALPELSDPGWSTPRRAHPDYVLAQIVLDIELGYLIEAFRSIRFHADGSRTIERPDPIYAGGETPTNSLFASTLFLLFGDHGMVDTTRGMKPKAGPSEGLNRSFIKILNRGLGLSHQAGVEELPENVELGIEFSQMPLRLSQPEMFPAWQSPDTASRAVQSRLWATEFFGELESTLRSELYSEYWWLFFLRSMLIDPKLQASLGPVSEPAADGLRRLYLRGDPGYMTAEVRGNREFYDEHVRLVYGGGARNNAELFLPKCTQSECTWAERPSYDDVMAYRGGRDSKGRLFELLRETPGVGLIFVRRNNASFRNDTSIPASTEIDVFDRETNQGRIRVFSEGPEGHDGPRLFHYQTITKGKDPIGYERYGQHGGTTGTYREWNDWTIADGSALVNVPAGIGGYLHSNNPAIGDVLVLHDEGWNFGENLGGHGAAHRNEKLTFFLASGPEIEQGALLARARWSTVTADDAMVGAALDTETREPSLLDIPPTALRWLGYDPLELDRFAEDEFESYMRSWLARQRGEILDGLGGMGTMERALDQAGVEEIEWDRLRPYLERMLLFAELEKDTWARPPSRPTEKGLELVLQ